MFIPIISIKANFYSTGISFEQSEKTMLTTPRQEDELPSAALSEQERRVRESSVPLSRYLRTEIDDDWRVYSSKEDEKTVSERPRDLSVLKSIKRFLANESPRAVDESASFDGGSYRVDYPFYDGEQPRQTVEKFAVSRSFNEQLTFDPDALRHENVRDVRQRKGEKTSEDVEGKIPIASRELDGRETVETEEKAAEKGAVPVVESAAPDNSNSTEKIAPAPEEKTFVVKYDDLVGAPLERLEQGNGTIGSQLIHEDVETRELSCSKLATDSEPTSTYVEPSFEVKRVEPIYVRRDRESKSRLTIFRRFVGLVDAREKQNSRSNEKSVAKSEFNSTSMERPSVERSEIDYGETVAFAVAPPIIDAEMICSPR